MRLLNRSNRRASARRAGRVDGAHARCGPSPAGGRRTRGTIPSVSASQNSRTHRCNLSTFERRDVVVFLPRSNGTLWKSKERYRTVGAGRGNLSSPSLSRAIRVIDDPFQSLAEVSPSRSRRGRSRGCGSGRARHPTAPHRLQPRLFLTSRNAGTHRRSSDDRDPASTLPRLLFAVAIRPDRPPAGAEQPAERAIG